MKEDCLFLNVITPAHAGDGLPVVVWWPGDGTVPDARRLALRGDVVVVIPNHRLGVLGYLALPGLDGGGDFGLADQVLATRWARLNAAAFGGDPQNVTVFGDGSGAFSACAFLTSPEAEGLVDKAILSSGSCRTAWPEHGRGLTEPAQTPYTELASAEEKGVADARRAGCPGDEALACLRRKPVGKLPGVPSRPAFGTALLPGDPATREALSVPVLSTVNSSEARISTTYRSQQVFTPRSYPAYVAAAYPGHENDVLGEYPLSEHKTPARAWNALIGDAAWACPTLFQNEALARGGSPVYAAELTGRTGIGERLTDDDTLIDHWAEFARTGSPGWPAGASVMRIGTGTPSATDFSAEHHCGFWKDVLPRQ